MSEDFSKNSIEAEIAELSQKIVEKRKQLESKSGVVEERELPRSAIGEQLGQAVVSPPSTSVASSSQPKPGMVSFDPAGGKSYLDYLSDESREIVTSLVSIAFDKGINEAIKVAEAQEPFILDAFHDVLRDKVFQEMKTRGLIR
ncbi:MAG: hypothetical protein HZA94_00435 [Candidatus Vogelbacteria bacterium]|nr:hypothetical protein [Candidatus Vogelbacteria bacterium]